MPRSFTAPGGVNVACTRDHRISLRMRFALTGDAASPSFAEFLDELAAALERAGFDRAGHDPTADLVVNAIDPEDPKPFRRRSRGTFVAAIHERETMPTDVLKANYPLLVRAL